ncbi:MAG TPA: hypothetical protein VFV42_01380 [Acidimicrobiales bacterium]|nr:hypothetical protein [Acidimicrobiales bacterium]
MTRPTTAASSHRVRGDRGEGVISTAIAVLIMALLGAAMWLTFDSIWSDTAENTEDQVNIIGSDSGGGAG